MPDKKDVLEYMEWDYQAAKLMQSRKKKEAYEQRGDWLYMKHNIRVSKWMQFVSWGSFDDHIHWSVDNFNGADFVMGDAQITLVPFHNFIQIMVFGCATVD